MKVLICGDLVPKNCNNNYFIENRKEELIDSSILNVMMESNLVIFNLECPITNTNKKINKNGPNLKCLPGSSNFFKDINSLVCLSNNHILDYGRNGLKDTIDELNKNSIKHIGASLSLKEEDNVFLKKELTIINVCEHEFSYNEEKNYGAYEFDILDCFKKIQEAKKNNNTVIIIYHGGKELYQYPTPNTQKRCRELAKIGADLIVCQHTHCIVAEEQYLNSKIIYGQGDFLFEYPGSMSNYGFAILYDTINKTIAYLPYRKNGIGISALEKDCTIMQEFYKRSEIIKDKNQLKKHYDDFCKQNIYTYLCSMKGYGKWRSRFEKYILKGKTTKRAKKEWKLKLLNYLICEQHNELISNWLKIEN